MKTKSGDGGDTAVMEPSVAELCEVLIVHHHEMGRMLPHAEALQRHYGARAVEEIRDQWITLQEGVLYLCRTGLDLFNARVAKRIHLDFALEEIAVAKASGDPLEGFAEALAELAGAQGCLDTAKREHDRLSRERVEELDRAARSDEEGAEQLADLDRRLAILARRIELATEELATGLRERAYAAAGHAVNKVATSAYAAASGLLDVVVVKLAGLLDPGGVMLQAEGPPADAREVILEVIEKMAEGHDDMSRSAWGPKKGLYQKIRQVAVLTAPGLASQSLNAAAEQLKSRLRGVEATDLEVVLGMLRSLGAQTAAQAAWAEKVRLMEKSLAAVAAELGGN